jgi:hypothetical protein
MKKRLTPYGGYQDGGYPIKNHKRRHQKRYHLAVALIRHWLKKKARQKGKRDILAAIAQ